MLEILDLGKNDMKAFVTSLVAMAVITVVAAVGFGALDMSADTVYTTKSGNVRL